MIVERDEGRERRALAVLTGLAVALGALALVGWVRVVREAAPVGQPLRVTACSPEDFTDGFCRGDPPVQPATLTLDESLRIPVSGRVTQSSGDDIPYDVEVAWENVETELRFASVSTPIVYEAHRDQPYEVEWAPPPQLLALSGDAEPGEDLGNWRIVGIAVPLGGDKVETYVWDSVKTFRLVAPG